MAKNSSGKIVAAVGAAVSTRSPRAAEMEAAMAAAAAMAQSEGVTDPDEIRALMLAARDRAKIAAAQ